MTLSQMALSQVTIYRSNDYTPYPITKLIETLKLLKPRIIAIVYCQRLGKENNLKDLQKTGSFIIDARGKPVLSKKLK